MKQEIKNLVWIDLEMTGLNSQIDKIIEIAIVVTDKDLNILDKKGFRRVIHLEDKDFKLMDAFVTKMHTENKLIEESINSPYTLDTVEKDALEYISQFIGEKESPLCGNSIWKDREFIAKYMPDINSYLHYRVIDISTLKQLTTLFNPNFKHYQKTNSDHTALNDIIQSIEELRYYKDKLFLPI